MFKRRSVIGLLLGVFFISAFVTGCGQEQEVVKEQELTVTTAAAGIRDIAKSVRLSGTVKGKDEVFILAKTSARVTGIPVKPGDYVQAGQTLITLDSSDYATGVQLAEVGLRMAELGLDTATTALERAEKLYEAGALSSREMEAARSGHEQAEVGVEQAQLNIQNAELMINNCTVTTPIAGVVGSINIAVGDMASPASPVAVISNTSQLEIEVQASESEINNIAVGEAADVIIKAVADKAFKGQIESVASVVDPMKRSYKVKVSLPNEEGLIKSGMLAEVGIATESKEGALCVPAAAIVPKGERTIVFVVDEEKRAREREITLGIENNNYVEIVSGISEGEGVITKGNTLVSDGTLVRVVTGGAK